MVSTMKTCHVIIFLISQELNTFSRKKCVPCYFTVIHNNATFREAANFILYIMFSLKVASSAEIVLWSFH